MIGLCGSLNTLSALGDLNIALGHTLNFTNDKRPYVPSLT
jgi:hypothetical protein